MNTSILAVSTDEAVERVRDVLDSFHAKRRRDMLLELRTMMGDQGRYPDAHQVTLRVPPGMGNHPCCEDVLLRQLKSLSIASRRALILELRPD